MAKKDIRLHIIFHGWQGSESSDIWSLEKACRDRLAITVFINAISSKDDYYQALWQIEAMLTDDIIPHIDGHYHTQTARENRSLSGFSMGGAMAFYYAVKHSDRFGAVTAYAATFHHQYHKRYHGVGKPPDVADAMLEEMMREEHILEENNILCLVRQKAEQIREHLRIAMHVGTDDIVYCDSEVMHLYLSSLDIPHSYRVFVDAPHDLAQIL